MLFSNKSKNPAVAIRVAMVALLLGIAVEWIVRPTSAFSQGMIDGARGVMFGVTIGCLIVAMRLTGRRSSSGAPPA